jgi:nucleotide-binding universal stress UspA family protein
MDVERRILVPVHASRSSRAALARARVLARATGAGLRVLSVRPARARSIEGLAFEGMDRAAAPEPAALPGLDMEVRSAVGDPLQVILAEAALPDVELLVIGYGERGWWARGLAPPLHERVVRHAPVPVLVVHARRAAEAPPLPPPDVDPRRRAPGLRLVNERTRPAS